MTNVLLVVEHCQDGRKLPSFSTFLWDGIKRALSYNFPECIIHTHLTSIVVNVQLAMACRPFPFFAGLREGGIPCR